MSNKDEERPIKRLTVDSEKLNQTIKALAECMETDDFERCNACIHELTLSDGRRCQILLEIEQEDSQGNFPSELEFTPLYSCIETEH